MTNKNFDGPLGMPAFDDDVLYYASNIAGRKRLRAWEFNGWKAESMSWKTSCYIHAGLSQIPVVAVKGGDAQRYLQSLLINSLKRFPVGTMKHAVMCNPDGFIAADGIIERRAENEFYSFAGGPPGRQAVPAGFDVSIEIREEYLFQVAGPNSLQVLEKATGEGLRDIGFFSFRESSIDGIKTEVARLGMSGNLAYELHGPIDEGPAIYEAVVKAGAEFGLERLGWRTYLVNHVEGGFPQSTWTFVATGGPPYREITGSVDPVNMRARFRTPVENRWHNMARFDHDFVGRDALEAEIAAPKRTTVTLRWNPEDVLDIYASLLRPGDEYKTIDLPYAPYWHPQAHADHIVKDGQQVGISSGTIYSYYYREVLSLACLDIGQSDPGNEVIVLWGDYGGKIKDVRATVARFPYFAEQRNREIDVESL